jgi:ABC-type multidrug transport system ATPase subunit
MCTPYIELKDIKHFDMPTAHNLLIEKGTTYQFIGKNGSGKTTLLKIIAGFIRPNEGVCINLAKKISIMPDIHYLPPNMTVYMYLHHLHELFREDIDKHLFYVLDLPLSKKIIQLSLGQKQKLAILQSFMGNPDLVLLDEPLKTLDAQSKKCVISYFKTCKASIIYTSHHYTKDSIIKTYAL